ncbi:MAG: efflux RND transporter periplasmic adaptor subunit [Opitutae bacterium]|nr:efflux RND transporter periplasmic adaptor subunit [Opitutae bacterium]
MKKALTVLVLLGLAAAGYYWYSSRAARAEATPEYTTATVARGDVVQVVTATGQLDAVLSVDVGSQISGQIIKLHADFNTTVKAGQKLVEIDPATYQQRLRQAEANLASAQASFTLAELNARRTKELFDKQLVTQQDSDQSQAQLQQAKAQLLTNQAAVENARVDLSRCTIFSPIDGIVISKQTEVGKTVASSLNVPVLFTIANDLAKMQITAAVAEADIGSVAEGQPVTFTVDAFPNRTFNGTITQVRNAPKNANNVVTYDTIIGVENRDLKLRPGMTANVSIVVAKREAVLRAPNAALRVRMPESIAVTQVASSAIAAGQAAPAAPTPPAQASAPAPGNGREGGRGGFMANLTPEQRQKMREIMVEIGFTPGSGPPSPEQREQMRKLMVERGVITAEQAAAASNRGSAGDPVIVTRTLYRLPRGDKSASPEAVSVRVGITDGLASEIVDGIAEGDVVITSVNLPGAKPAGAQSNPFGGARRF